METVKVSKKYQVVIPEKIRKQAGIKPGDKMIAISKHRVLHYVPVRSIKDTKGITPGLDTKDLRDESD
jgi:AbrB family looped-hinge helix DNA binding protein